MVEEFGYIAIQSTRPQTLAAGLVDSPVEQLARIVDKFREWTHPRPALPDDVIDRDRLPTNVMIYRLTGTAGTSAYVGYAHPEVRGRRTIGHAPTPPAPVCVRHHAGRAHEHRDA